MWLANWQAPLPPLDLSQTFNNKVIAPLENSCTTGVCLTNSRDSPIS